MSDPMGHQHETKPVTASDKIMSKRHLNHRAEVDSMKGIPKLLKSAQYNLPHAKEHLKAAKDVAKKLKDSKPDVADKVKKQIKAIKKSIK
ncbi:MAG TPA: hypothetical protein VF974_04810 [Patescibacteria group bacterium]